MEGEGKLRMERREKRQGKKNTKRKQKEENT